MSIDLRAERQARQVDGPFEFRPRNHYYMQIQAGVFIGLALFGLLLHLLGFEFGWSVVRQALIMLPMFILLPVLTNLADWPTHKKNRIVIDAATLTGPVKNGRKLARRTIAIAEIDTKRTESASNKNARLLGPVKIYSQSGETILLDVIGLGRGQIREIYELLGCTPPCFPLDNLFEVLGFWINERRRYLGTIVMLTITGTWLFMIVAEGTNLVESTLGPYLIGIGCGIGITYYFMQLKTLE